MRQRNTPSYMIIGSFGLNTGEGVGAALELLALVALGGGGRRTLRPSLVCAKKLFSRNGQYNLKCWVMEIRRILMWHSSHEMRSESCGTVALNGCFPFKRRL